MRLLLSIFLLASTPIFCMNLQHGVEEAIGLNLDSRRILPLPPIPTKTSAPLFIKLTQLEEEISNSECPQVTHIVIRPKKSHKHTSAFNPYTGLQHLVKNRPVLVEHVRTIKKQYPSLKCLDLTGSPLENKEVFNQLAQLEELNKLHITLTDENNFKDLAISPLAKKLISLKLQGASITRNDFTSANLNNFEHLIELDLRDVVITDDLVQELCASKTVTQLTTLLLGKLITDTDNLSKLMSCCKSLKKLCYNDESENNNKIFNCIAQSDCTQNLEVLQFIAGDLKTSFCRENLNRFKALKTLIIQGLDDKLFTELSKSVLAQTITTLDLILTDITSEGLTATNLYKFINLKKLYISSQVGAQGIKALTKSLIVLRNLKEIVLDDWVVRVETNSELKAAFKELKEKQSEVSVSIQCDLYAFVKEHSAF